MAEGRAMAAKREAFVAALRKSANVSRSAAAAGISASTVYRWRSASRTFRSSWDAAIDAALDDLEEALLGRAVRGVVKPIMYAGRRVASTRTFADNAAMFILRARRPQIYARSGHPGAPGTTDESMALAELEQRLDRVAQSGAEE